MLFCLSIAVVLLSDRQFRQMGIDDDVFVTLDPIHLIHFPLFISNNTLCLAWIPSCVLILRVSLIKEIERGAQIGSRTGLSCNHPNFQEAGPCYLPYQVLPQGVRQKNHPRHPTRVGGRGGS